MGRNFRNDARGIGCEGLIAARGKRGTGTRSIRSLEIAQNRDALAFAEERRKTTCQEGRGEHRSVSGDRWRGRRADLHGSDRVAGAASRIANRRITNIWMIRE